MSSPESINQSPDKSPKTPWDDLAEAVPFNDPENTNDALENTPDSTPESAPKNNPENTTDSPKDAPEPTQDRPKLSFKRDPLHMRHHQGPVILSIEEMKNRSRASVEAANQAYGPEFSEANSAVFANFESATEEIRDAATVIQRYDDDRLHRRINTVPGATSSPSPRETAYLEAQRLIDKRSEDAYRASVQYALLNFGFTGQDLPDKKEHPFDFVKPEQYYLDHSEGHGKDYLVKNTENLPLTEYLEHAATTYANWEHQAKRGLDSAKSRLNQTIHDMNGHNIFKRISANRRIADLQEEHDMAETEYRQIHQLAAATAHFPGLSKAEDTPPEIASETTPEIASEDAEKIA